MIQKITPKMDVKILVIFVGIIQGLNCLIVPDEVPSLLSIVYSQIPPIKKGTDSRLGWGFRLGDHADIQVLVELGPQTNTRPLSNEGDKNNKRNVDNNLRNTLWAQNQLLKQKRKQEQISNTDGGKWIQSWSASMNPENPAYPAPSAPAQISEEVEGAGEIPAALVIPEELEDLYGKSKSAEKVERVQEEKPVSSLFPGVLAELYGKTVVENPEDVVKTSDENVRLVLKEYLKENPKNIKIN